MINQMDKVAAIMDLLSSFYDKQEIRTYIFPDENKYYEENET